MQGKEEKVREKNWYQRKRSKCKSCGADIIWSKTTAGKWIPLDTDVQRRAIYYPRTIVMDCLINGKEEAKLDRIEIVPTYGVHFQTCPQAKEHRVRK